MKISLLLLPFIFLTGITAAQQKIPAAPREVFGTVIDSTGALPGIRIKLTAAKDTFETTTNLKGLFDFPKVSTTKFKITVSGMGYQAVSRRYTMDKGTGPVKLKPIMLMQQNNMLQTVTISGEIPVSVKEDTIEYKASAYKVRDGSPVEELLKKLPGVSVDANGNVTAQGKPITKVRVDGKDYFMGDVQTATQNLPADIVDNIQVIDDYGDQANLTGIKTGDPEKILNITIQKGKRKGQFGYASAAAGTDNRYAGRISANSFNNDRQIAVLGTVNNNNTNVFNMGQSAGGVSTANGTTVTRAAGFNYRDSWGKKITVYGSYSFSDRSNTTTSNALQEDVFQSGSLINNDNRDNRNHNINHRLDFNLEYKIDTLNYLKIRPNFSYSTSDGNNSDIFNDMRLGKNVTGSEFSLSNGHSPGGGATVLYNHRFHKRGRNFSIIGSYNHSENTQGLNDRYTSIQDSIVSPLFQQINTSSSSNTFHIHASYMEPLGKTTYLEANYTFSRNNTDNQRYNYRIDPKTGAQTYVDSLSDVYNNQFTYNRLGINLRGIKEKYNYTVGLAAQPNTLSGEANGFSQTTNTFNWVPTARFVYKFKHKQMLTINYSGSSQQPSFGQLQSRPDYSNPQNIVYGNPDLKPAFSNTIHLRYDQFDFKTGSSLFTNLSFNTIQNQIVASTEPIISTASADGTTVSNSARQETHYQNTNGFYAVNGNYSISQPFDNRKFTVSLMGSAAYNNNISYIEGERNQGKNTVLTQGARLRISIDDVMDTQIDGSYSVNHTAYSLSSAINTDAETWDFGLDGRNYFFTHWVLGYRLTQTINHGFSSTVVENPTLLSTYLEFQFLQKNAASFRFQAFDLFDENKGISRTVNGNEIIDTRTNRLGRYFMLSFTYRLQKFGGHHGGFGGHGFGKRHHG